MAERVSDDIPASRIMMQYGFLSLLSTLDVKSFPPPGGDLINRAEFGSPDNPSDKRRYGAHLEVGGGGRRLKTTALWKQVIKATIYPGKT
ncbi:BsaWI family type II restriction enzyme [Limnospira fusiformis KN01]|nr:BsaWI family type II restriction enzyme [Limnospira fusiformis]EKD07251.1 hypothetical protein SPLC1_S450020 [Arthrospira platensis C1]ULB47248.1 BsaWI family type II restriction enzyme [Limnospira fusiformis KN01]